MSTEVFERGNRYCYCKTLTPLKSKGQGHWFWAFDAGATEFYEMLTNLDECEEGLYTVESCNISTDWETGYIDDYNYKLVPYKEKNNDK